jgi:hypothetical protein
MKKDKLCLQKSSKSKKQKGIATDAATMDVVATTN